MQATQGEPDAADEDKVPGGRFRYPDQLGIAEDLALLRQVRRWASAPRRPGRVACYC